MIWGSSKQFQLSVKWLSVQSGRRFKNKKCFLKCLKVKLKVAPLPEAFFMQTMLPLFSVFSCSATFSFLFCSILSSHSHHIYHSWSFSAWLLLTPWPSFLPSILPRPERLPVWTPLFSYLTSSSFLLFLSSEMSAFSQNMTLWKLLEPSQSLKCTWLFLRGIVAPFGSDSTEVQLNWTGT